MFLFLPSLLECFQVLQEKFTEFASETGSVGQERVTAVNQMVDELIDYGHAEAATIAEWKDGVNEAWADLLELMETRAQMLAASHQLHKFFSDCKEVRRRAAAGVFMIISRGTLFFFYSECKPLWIFDNTD